MTLGVPWEPWTDERAEELARLWKSGLSASQVAAQLGGVSRNAVISKVHRLGMAVRGRTVGMEMRMAMGLAPVVKVKARRPSASQRQDLAKTLGRTAFAGASVATKRPAEPPLPPAALFLPLTALTDRSQCRWPIGDPRADGFGFCAVKTDSQPYCEFHRLLAYQPAGRR